MTRPRVVRLLRISTSAVCVVACLLLIALWVRSYWRLDKLASHVFTGDIMRCAHLKGNFLIQIAPPASYDSTPVELLRRRVIRGSRFGYRPVYLFPNPTTPPTNPIGGVLCLPYFVPVLAFATTGVIAAALPWIPWRFSLRTLLIATTLVAVVLGLVVLFADRKPMSPPIDHVDVPEF